MKPVVFYLGCVLSLTDTVRAAGASSDDGQRTLAVRREDQICVRIKRRGVAIVTAPVTSMQRLTAMVRMTY